MKRSVSNHPVERLPQSFVKPGYPASNNKNIRKVVILNPGPWHRSRCLDRTVHNKIREDCHLNLLSSASLRVVDLVASLATLVRPREVCDGNDEEGVAAVGNTGKSVVPGGKGSKHTEGTASSEAGNVTVLKVRDTEHEECEIESEE